MRRVLLIEPQAESRGALESLFELPAWEVVYAQDNEAALEQAKAECFDLIVTNAETSGAEDIVLLRKLRSVRPHTRLVILTKQKMPGDVLNALRYHAFSYFTVPVPREDLRVLIEDIVNAPAWDDGIELLQGTQEYVVVAVRCDLGTLDRLVQFVRAGVDFPEAEKEEVAFAFREIVLNAMEHGGRFDPEKFVEVCYLKSKRQVTCRVKDPGEGFSLEEVMSAQKARPLPEVDGRGDSEQDLGGLGILLARHYVDELIYNESGNEVFLVKWLPPCS
ncbi:MAG TPA: ATP-binding protein [Dongiaceae bacterium]|nr:ATP-binding protein [Dongiaceae bacterium]